jgi:hypothetical protein
LRPKLMLMFSLSIDLEESVEYGVFFGFV